MNVFNIKRSFADKKRKGWKNIYWVIDLHDTVITGTYNFNNKGAEIFPYAREFFAWARKRVDIVLILWTSSHLSPLQDVLNNLRDNGIEFDYLNSNPEESDTKLCDFGKKFYFNILLDDKAGFEGATDWELVINELKEIGEWQ